MTYCFADLRKNNAMSKLSIFAQDKILFSIYNSYLKGQTICYVFYKNSYMYVCNFIKKTLF